LRKLEGYKNLKKNIFLKIFLYLESNNFNTKMKLSPKRKFICPATGLIADIKHCKSYGNGSSASGVDSGCKYFKNGECTYDED